jgi:hypothetical protein
VLAYGDAWFPTYAPTGVLARAAELRARASRPISLQLIGIPAEAKEIEAYEAAGFDRVVYWLPSAGRSVVERAFDAYESAIADFTGS